MSWYNLGTVTLTTGSAIVDGAGTAFVGNVTAGQALLTPDGRLMEIAEVISSTRLRLVRVYAGGSVGGVAYDIIPTSANLTEVIDRLKDLIARYRGVVEGVGQGLFPDGTTAAPGIRFAVDQDTGLRRVNGNVVSIVTGGVDRMLIDSTGKVGVGGAPSFPLDVFSAGGTYVGRFTNTAPGSEEYAVVLFGQAEAGTAQGYIGTGGSAVANAAFRGNFVVGTQNSRPLVFATGDGEKARIDATGNLLVGITSAIAHSFYKPVTTGPLSVFGSTATAARSLQVQACDAEGFGGVATALYVGRATVSGRSINAGGTVNTSGADYAEYMVKAAGCGTIAKGDVCGVDMDGRLTKTWADAISFVIKSTDPSYVGGDTWGQSVGPCPKGPGEEPVAPTSPPAAPASEAEADVAAWQAIVAAYPAQVAAYQSAHAAWTDAKAAYDTALPAWEAALEAERQKVDRIAFAGQVPVNVTGDFAVGDYIIAAASGAGIKAVAVPLADITFDQYRRRLGKVWAVRDGRAWVDVQHG